MAYLAYSVNYRGYYRFNQFLLTSDLDLSDYWWDSIGLDDDHSFSGNFDGGGHTISGLYTKPSSNIQAYQAQYSGLFGYVKNQESKPISIHDIGVINANLSVLEGGYVGGIIGYLSSYYNYGDRTATSVYNCYFDGEINADTGRYDSITAGGIIGMASNRSILNLENCYNLGNITIASEADEYSSYADIGGIVGRASSSFIIKNCYNTGDIFGPCRVGGICGYSLDVSLINCYNIGNITNVYPYFPSTDDEFYSGAGGLIASCNLLYDECYIVNCYNLGEINGSGRDGNSIGGLVGKLDGNGDYNACIYNSFNCGEVVKRYAVLKAGGIVGEVSGSNYDSEYNYYGGNCTLGFAFGGSLGSSAGTKIDELDSLAYAKGISWYLTAANWHADYPWDFENTWMIVEGVNDGYPILNYTAETLSFTITYHPNGASGSEVVESKVGSESYTIRSNMFTRSGYNFTGWNTQANGGGTSYSAGSSYSELANLDLYAQWSRITYTIKYNKNASDATGSMANTTKYYGTNVTLRSNAFKRTGYSFAGWATEKGGNVVYSNGATYTANANVTLYAKWTAHKYTVKFNGNGSTSGSMSNQTFTYGTAQKLTSNAFKKTGFTFSKWTRNADGTGTSYTNGQSVSNLTSSNGATINLYAQWTARNEAKYDSAGKYWYIENGKIPQTKVTNSTLISNLNKATTNGANYYIAGQTLTAKVYSGKEYCKWNNNWYEVEPIKWRLDASSSQKDGYGTTTDTNAVLAEIVYVDQYSSSSIDAGEGYSNQSVTDFMRNGISTTYLVNYSSSTQTFGTGTSLYGTNASTTARMFVSSQSEITNVVGNMNMTFSDLVEDMIKYYGGTNVYFTRDLGSNYNNIVCFNEVGREVQRFATDYRGVQFTVRFTEYGCVN